MSEGEGAEWDKTYTQILSPATLAGINTETMTVLHFSPSRSTVTLWKHNYLTGYIVKMGCANWSCNCSKVLQGETNHINRLYILSGSLSWPKLDYRAHSKYCNPKVSRAGNLNKNRNWTQLTSVHVFGEVLHNWFQFWNGSSHSVEWKEDRDSMTLSCAIGFKELLAQSMEFLWWPLQFVFENKTKATSRNVTIKVPIPVLLDVSLNCSSWFVFHLDCWVEIKCINIWQPCHRSLDSENSSILMKPYKPNPWMLEILPGSLSQWVGWWWSIVTWRWDWLEQCHGDCHSPSPQEGAGDKMGTSWFHSSDFFFFLIMLSISAIRWDQDLKIPIGRRNTELQNTENSVKRASAIYVLSKHKGHCTMSFLHSAYAPAV